MNTERFARLKQLVLEVADRFSTDRTACLDEIERGDPAMRPSIESLLGCEVMDGRPCYRSTT